MGRFGENLRSRAIAVRLEEINEATLGLTKELLGAGINVEEIDIEHWPRYNGNQIGLKIWDGKDHVREPKGLDIFLTKDDVVALAKRRQILKRKF